MGRRRNDKKISLDVSGFGSLVFWSQLPGFITGIIFAVLLVLGILFWYLLFELQNPDATKILIVEAVIMVLALAGNLLMISFVGYDGFLRNFSATYVLNIIGAVIGLYIAGVQLIANPGASQLVAFWHFILFLVISALMALAPTIAICAVMSLIMTLFGSYR